MPRRYAGLGPSRARTGFLGSSTRPMSAASQNSTLPCAMTTFPVSLLLSFSCRCLAASTSSFLQAAVNLRPPSVTVSTYTPGSNAIAFQTPAITNIRISLFQQSVHLSPPHPLLSALHYRPSEGKFVRISQFFRLNISIHFIFPPGCMYACMYGHRI